jgi:(1->4)-alpha-D-glucan 1-alpha-D-glucosylmutase
MNENRPLHLPICTYRLQFHQGFRFVDATALVPYLAALGISDCYASPYLAARPGSTHGYDITNHAHLNPEVGTEEEHDRFCRALQDHGLSLVLDFVPNHMGIDPRANLWWRDVLENGPSSPFARFFDIDWEPVKDELHYKVLLPILGDQYGRVLERGELRLAFDRGAFVLHYFDNELPINPRQTTRILRHNLDGLRAELPDEDPAMREFLSVASELQNLPPYTNTDPERSAERQREKEVARERLSRLVDSAPRIGRHIEEAVRFFNGRPGDPDSFNGLHDLLEAQPYRLSYWRTASHEINYRRFFDINELAGLRMARQEVFAATHRLVRRLIADRKVQGLRIDHPDGLYDPAEYFERLQELASEEWTPAADPARPVAAAQRPLYIVAEKILSAEETLPCEWLVHGTTGYNFLNDLNGLFIASENARALKRHYIRFSRRVEPFDEVVYQSKKLIMETAMASELNVLAYALNRISERNRRSRDFTLNSLRDVLTEIVACFPVYRSYVRHSGWTTSDRETVEIAVRRALRRSPVTEPSIFDFVREVLLPRRPDASDNLPDRRDGYAAIAEDDYEQRAHVAMKFQQYTAPVQAKGVEDTAFYRYNVLLSLNEVGGDPARIGRIPAKFHEANLARRDRWPYEMLATATHDSKLGEDVRARLNVLSEIPEEWRREVGVWARLNAANRTLVDNEPAPDRNDEFRFYQILVGAWPADDLRDTRQAASGFVSRVREYMIKSIREAKVHTSWINQYKPYDDATAAFVEKALTGPGAGKFLARFLPFVRRIAHAGMLNSLSQVVLKIASPGVPDFYQGTELWALTLVDPDNRRPVDYERRRTYLQALAPLLKPDGESAESANDRAGAVSEMLANWRDGRIKLYVTARGLGFRRRHPDLLLDGNYVPLDTDITVSAGLVAFARTLRDRALIALTPRLLSKIAPDPQLPLGAESWKTSRVFLPEGLPAGPYRNLLTGESVQPLVRENERWLFAGDVFRTAPVAMLVNE